MESIREYSICLGGGVHTNQDIYCTYCNLPDIVTCSTIKGWMQHQCSSRPVCQAIRYTRWNLIHGHTWPHNPAWSRMNSFHQFVICPPSHAPLFMPSSRKARSAGSGPCESVTSRVGLGNDCLTMLEACSALKVMAEFGNWHGVACDASSHSNLSAKEILTTFFKNFSEGKLALALAMDSDSVLYIIKGSWEAILPSYGQIEFWDLKWWYIL